MKKWNELSLSEKADLMKLYVANGVKTISDMENHYNSMANGGPLDELLAENGNNINYGSNGNIPVVRYDNGGKKQTFKRWSRQISKYKGIDVKHDNTYDYRGFYDEDPDRAYAMLDENPDAHFIDKYKMPNHPTFSDESIYSNDEQKGGHWSQMPDGRWIFEHSDYTYEHSDETNKYLRENDPSALATYMGGVVLDGASHGFEEKLKKAFAKRYKGEFKDAFDAARNDGKEFFKWRGSRYNTRLSLEDYLAEMDGDKPKEKTLMTYSDATDEMKQHLTNKIRYNGQSYNIESVANTGEKHYPVVERRYTGITDAMKRKGFTDEEINRLSPFLTTQLILEGGYRLERDDNNFGGMKIEGTSDNIRFKTEDQFYDKYLDNLDDKWGDKYLGEGRGWRNAKTLQQYADTINREELSLHTKEAFDEYNNKHKNNPAYLYTPLWENNFTDLMSEHKFGGIHNRAEAMIELYKKRYNEFNELAKNNNLYK